MSTRLKGITIILVALLILVVLIVLYLKTERVTQTQFLFTSPTPSPALFLKKPAGERVICTADVKRCLDGTYVGRVAPYCTFAPCPRVTTIQ